MITKRGKCQSCGDVADLYGYNNTLSCAVCLAMDRKGVSRDNILNNILSRNKGRNGLQKTRRKRRGTDND